MTGFAKFLLPSCIAVGLIILWIWSGQMNSWIDRCADDFSPSYFTDEQSRSVACSHTHK